AVADAVGDETRSFAGQSGAQGLGSLAAPLPVHHQGRQPPQGTLDYFCTVTADADGILGRLHYGADIFQGTTPLFRSLLLLLSQLSTNVKAFPGGQLLV